MIDILISDIVWVLVGKNGVIDVVLFSQIQQMIINVIGSEEFLKDLFRVCSEFILSHKLTIFQKPFFQDLIPILVINGALLV